ncbi:MAG: restriction endonuclease subunit S [Candidatus Peribacteria bacterium]|nr:restriction endonuclease subunit S [Candidatus Peribacteria bacterium]
MITKEYDSFAFGSFMIKFALNGSTEINREFLQIWLNNKLNQNFIEQEKIGAIQGNITIDTIKNFRLPLPSFEIQERIANEVKRRIEKAKLLEGEARELYERARSEVEGMILNSK